MPAEGWGRLASRVLVGLVLAELACGSAEPGPSGQPMIARRASAASTSGLVTYHGGKVLSGAQVVVVFWGSDFPADVLDGAPETYRTLSELSDLDWISEYDTASQHIRRPSFAGQVVIEPGDAGTTLVQAQIVAELISQLDAGVLPAATEDSYYAVYFPFGTIIELGDNRTRSCVSWDAFHGSLGAGSPGTYAVFPSCGAAPAEAVHELFEAVTDPHFDGWYTEDGGAEIADLCQTDTTSLQLPDGGRLVAQALWSDVAGGCLGSGNQFALSIEPTTAAVAPVLTFTVSMTPPRNPYAQLTWKVTGLPAGATASPPRQDGQDRWTFSVDVPHADTPFSVTVQARTESWTAFVAAPVSVPTAPSAPATAGCSQSGGSAGPVGIAALFVLAVLRPRRRA